MRASLLTGCIENASPPSTGSYVPKEPAAPSHDVGESKTFPFQTSRWLGFGLALVPGLSWQFTHIAVSASSLRSFAFPSLCMLWQSEHVPLLPVKPACEPGVPALKASRLWQVLQRLTVLPDGYFRFASAGEPCAKWQ